MNNKRYILQIPLWPISTDPTSHDEPYIKYLRLLVKVLKPIHL